MANIKENTVSAVNQLGKLPDTFFVGDKKGDLKVQIFGNSITRHGVKPEIGWENCWGMAASSEENDYVHVLCKLLKIKGYNPCLRIKQISPWERGFADINTEEFFAEEKKFKPDIIILRIGENIKYDLSDELKNSLFNKTNELLEYIKTDRTKVILNTCFWANPAVDEVFTEVSKSYDRLVKLGDLGCDDKMLAKGKFWHEGVQIHPGDLGMKTIAERLYKAIID